MDYIAEIRRIRTEQSVSLAALADGAGVAKSTLQLIEAGKTNPTVETLEKIFAFLGYGLQVSAKKLRKTPEKQTSK